MLAELTAVQNVESAPIDATSGQPQTRKLERAEQLATRVFRRELSALWDAETDEGILLYEGGGKRPKVPYQASRQYAPDATVSILVEAKLIKFQRTENYPDGAVNAAYQITPKGQRWLDEARAIKQERYVERSLKALAISTDPAMQKLQRSIELGQQVAQLPEYDQQAMKTVLEVLTLPNRFEWMDRETINLLLVVYANTLEGAMRETILETVQGRKTTDES